MIPRQLSDNAGFDATDILNKLRQKHALPNGEGKLYGVDVNKGDIVDTFAAFVWEPSLVKVRQGRLLRWFSPTLPRLALKTPGAVRRLW